VVLVDVEGLPVAQAADLLGVPVGTVKSRAARSRALLAEQLRHLRPGNHAAAPAVFQGREVIGDGS
jgi:RNA polymerase sigma-70 factor (ECF subfamily)